MKKCGFAFLLVAFLSLSPGVWGQEADAVKRSPEAALSILPKTPQLKPIMRNGKPFFPIGAYGVPNDIDVKTLAENGWNTILDQGAGLSTPQEILKKLDALQEAGLAGIIGVQNFPKENKEKELRDLVKTISPHPALLGYYLYDEPENNFYTAQEFKDQKGDLSDLNVFIRRKIGWINQTIRAVETNPEHETFLCIAWWTEYRNLQPLCDINMPNEYPTGNTTKEFEGLWPNVPFDAKIAAEAAWLTGKEKGFIYTPLAIDTMAALESLNLRAPTVNEFRYSAFAPITEGAMGMIFWAAYRCTKSYTEQVVLPVTRQLAELSPFFLGENLNDSLIAEPSQSLTELLKKYEIPAVSACLRRIEGDRCLLLAVNNTPEPLNVSLTLNLKGLPPKAKDALGGKEIAIKKGLIEDVLTPYGVCAYEFRMIKTGKVHAKPKEK